MSHHTQKRKYKLKEDAVPTKFSSSKENQKRCSSEMRQGKTKNKLLIHELDTNILGTATPDKVPPSSSNFSAHINETILLETPHQLCMVSVSTQAKLTRPILECITILTLKYHLKMMIRMAVLLPKNTTRTLLLK